MLFKSFMHRLKVFSSTHQKQRAIYPVSFFGLFTGGHRTRVAAVTLDNMAERVFAQREDFP